jgi:5-methylcytosine-specific restriction endonuclease McrA
MSYVPGYVSKRKKKLLNHRQIVRKNSHAARIERYSKARIANLNFLESNAWRMKRFEAFAKYGNICQCCGMRPPQVTLHVDHVKPRMTHPELALDITNLQILCEACNIGKGARYSMDFRR